MALMKSAKPSPVKTGDIAPDFTLPSQSGEQISLTGLLTQGPVVLYFYPKDNTAGCTAEACSFRDHYEVFNDAGATVVGVSRDSEASHAAFAAKHRLPFILLTDKDGTVNKRYGVPSPLGLLPGRTTYVIDQQGVVRHVFNSMLGATKHVDEALRTVQTMRQQPRKS
jgi:peroxiredoxin Q/BCP